MNTNSINTEQIISNILNQNEAKAIFIKDSIPGKMHFDALYSCHTNELPYTPKKVYQIYLPFDLKGKIINLTHSKDMSATISEFQSNLMNELQKKVFIQLVKPEKGRNDFDASVNKEVSEELGLFTFDLWQGVMFYFFV